MSEVVVEIAGAPGLVVTLPGTGESRLRGRAVVPQGTRYRSSLDDAIRNVGKQPLDADEMPLCFIVEGEKAADYPTLLEAAEQLVLGARRESAEANMERYRKVAEQRAATARGEQAKADALKAPARRGRPRKAVGKES